MFRQLSAWSFVAAAAVVACRSGDARRVAPEDGAPVSKPADLASADAPAAAPAPHYTIHFPAPPKVNETSVNTVDGPMPQRVELAELEGTTYLVVTGSMPTGLQPGNQSGSLDRVLAMFGATATSDVPIKLGGIEGREVHFTGMGSGVLRTFGVGSWMLQAGVVARGHGVDDQRAKQFLDSLQITH